MKENYIYSSDKQFMEEETTKLTDIKDYQPKEADEIPLDEVKYSQAINEGD